MPYVARFYFNVLKINTNKKTETTDLQKPQILAKPLEMAASKLKTPNVANS